MIGERVARRALPRLKDTSIRATRFLEFPDEIMAINERISKLIWGQCAGRCCMCREELIHAKGSGGHSLLGEIAHIVGETTAAARGDSCLTRAERGEPENLLLLCRPHHKLVDDDPITYTVESLRSAKTQHVSWVAAQLVKAKPWRSPMSQLTYINVPRLCEQAAMQGYSVDLSRYKKQQTLHSLAWELNHVMDAFQAVLSRLHLEAVPIESVVVHEAYIGTNISFDRRKFRTKNIPVPTRSTMPVTSEFTGSLVSDPHIYAKVGAAKVVLRIDPRWITTSTAGSLFHPDSGQATFSGIGKITAVDYGSGVVTVTPWAIGLPRGLFDSDAAQSDGLSTASEVEQPTAEPTQPSSSGGLERASLDEYVDLKRANDNPCYLSPSPTQCDLCREPLSSQRYMVDGAVRRSGGMWACMCAHCFSSRGRDIGWGHGQLYLNDPKGWLLVAGFAPGQTDELV